MRIEINDGEKGYKVRELGSGARTARVAYCTTFPEALDYARELFGGETVEAEPASVLCQDCGQPRAQYYLAGCGSCDHAFQLRDMLMRLSVCKKCGEASLTPL